MPARERLNVAYFQGSVAAAAIVGFAFSSWTAFAVAMSALLVANLLAGDIRPTTGGR